MGQTRGLFQKTGDFKGTFHERMGTLQEGNNKGLIKVEEIKKRWQEYTEVLFK